jgi:hypothetical protein
MFTTKQAVLISRAKLVVMTVESGLCSCVNKIRQSFNLGKSIMPQLCERLNVEFITIFDKGYRWIVAGLSAGGQKCLQRIPSQLYV